MVTTSLISPDQSRAPFSKQQMLEELVEFMPAFVDCLRTVYGTTLQLSLTSVPIPYRVSWHPLAETPLWSSVVELYDYGVLGVGPAPEELEEGYLHDAVVFLENIDVLNPILGLVDARAPRLASIAASMAIARQRLDEGDEGARVAVKPLAHLACQDPEAVANQLNVAPDDDVVVAEARRWLRSNACFQPTGFAAVPPFAFAPTRSVDVPLDVWRAVTERAGENGCTRFDILRDAFADEISRDPLYGPSRLDSVQTMETTR